LKKKMRLRLIPLSIVFLALAGNPSFAKDSHAPHGARASATNTGASGKGPSGATLAPGKANAPIEARETIAPPVLPPHGITQTQQPVRIINPSGKNPVNAPHGQATGVTNTAPAVHSAIGQPVVTSKNSVGLQPVSPALRAPGVVSPPIGSPGTARLDVANATTRGGVNGATVTRPAIAPSAIGGPAQPRYGINGTTVKIKH
jgi:hypothetical protein